jgi:hypothetical protein
MINILIFGAFFCYGIFTIQRNGFLLDFLPNFWKKFPKQLHEPLFSCGICVSSIWGSIFIVSSYLIQENVNEKYQILAMMPLYLIAFIGFTAIIDRAVKSFEYNYRYTQIKPLSNYSYLENYEFRDSMIECFLSDALNSNLLLVEIGGLTERYAHLTNEGKYVSYDKANGTDIVNSYISEDYFLLIKGIAFEGNFDYLMGLASNAKGFVIEGSLAGDSGKQLKWIMDAFPSVIKMPYMTNCSVEAPTHCAGDVNNRIVLVKKIVK